MKTTSDLKEKILELKKRKNAVILAHYYQEEAIQEIADFVGDSLELSRKASQVDADIEYIFVATEQQRQIILSLISIDKDKIKISKWSTQR